MPRGMTTKEQLAWHEFRLDFHAAIIAKIINSLGDTDMATQEELDAAVAELNTSISAIDAASTATQALVDAIQVELDNLKAQVDAGQPVDLTGLNAAVAAAQQEATDLSNLAADAASSLPPAPDNTLPPVEEAPPVDEMNPPPHPEQL